MRNVGSIGRGTASGREIAERVRASLGYLSLHLSPSGRFDSESTRTQGEYDILVHASAATVLYRLVGSPFADASLNATAGRAFSYVRQHLSPVKCRECCSEHGMRLIDSGIAKLGGTAHALLALAARIDRSPSASADDVQLVVALARYLTSQQDEEGRFRADVDTTTGEGTVSQSPHDAGTAVLALCAAYRVAGHAEHREGAVRGAEHLIRLRISAGGNKESVSTATPDPWLMRVLAELHVLAPGAMWIEQLRALTAPLVLGPPSTPISEAESLPWLRGPTEVEVAARVEGLLAAFAVERRLGERTRAASLLRAILAGLGQYYRPRTSEVLGLEEVRNMLAVSFGLLQLLARGRACAARAAEDQPSLTGRTQRSHESAPPAMGPPVRLLVGHRVALDPLFSIAPAVARRSWMDATTGRFANRCLPLLIANQAGWMLSLPEPFEVEWSGEDGLDQVSVFGSDNIRKVVSSHFGHGIVTFETQFLFRTEPGYNLLIRGPANLPKDGISPLEGIVETDWTAATFTMNWQITRPHHRVSFAAGEPIGMLVPMRRGELETFAPELHRLNDDRELAHRYFCWRNERRNFIRALKQGDETAVQAGWQRDYVLGRDTGSEAVASQHQTKLLLRPFSKTWQD